MAAQRGGVGSTGCWTGVQSTQVQSLRVQSPRVQGLGPQDTCSAPPTPPECPLDDMVGAHTDYNEEEEEQKYFRRKRLGVVKNVLAASLAAMLTYSVYLGLLQMQLILHYDETYREVKYSNMELEDIDRKVLMGINVTPVVALLYTPVLIRFFGTKWTMFLTVGIYALFVSSNYWERYFTLVPSAVAIGVAIVPLWASLGNSGTGQRLTHAPLQDGTEVLRVCQLQGGARAGAAASTTWSLQRLHCRLPDHLLHLLPCEGQQGQGGDKWNSPVLNVHRSASCS
uniref:Unc-93 homolog B1, TLR signaling regulator n=1 Tax=Phasianus colchicus TaxID=9054 RepID=A0A669QDH6_PHACC